MIRLPLALAAMMAAPVPGSALAQDVGASGALRWATDPRVASVQRDAVQIVKTYEAGLNAADTAAILQLFAEDAVAEWENKPTMVGRRAMGDAYDALFRTARFNTGFQFDAADIHGDVAIVRTHHPLGQTELELKTGARKLDFNRETFVLKREGNGAPWRIVFYAFNTQPRQGEQ